MMVNNLCFNLNLHAAGCSSEQMQNIVRYVHIFLLNTSEYKAILFIRIRYIKANSKIQGQNSICFPKMLLSSCHLIRTKQQYSRLQQQIIAVNVYLLL